MSDNRFENSTVTKSKITRPRNYVAVILNDDFSTFQAVEFVLQMYFEKNAEDSAMIAQEIHKNGKGVAGGPYSLDVCQTKCMEAMDFAKMNDMPLMVVAEPA
jgi:ATP-dependent Clp protease adaptor protein ClpS